MLAGGCGWAFGQGQAIHWAFRSLRQLKKPHVHTYISLGSFENEWSELLSGGKVYPFVNQIFWPIFLTIALSTLLL